MDRNQVSEILERIQANRQSFLITNAVVNEWCNVLAPYDYYDVTKKLDDYFRDSDNFGRYPDVYYLIRYLKTIEEKKIMSVPHALCQICGQAVKFEDYQKHYDRCSSVEYITEMSKRYLEKSLSREKLMATDDKTFEKYYYSTCKEIYFQMPDGFPKHLLENVLLTHMGKEPNLNFEDVVKEMDFK